MYFVTLLYVTALTVTQIFGEQPKVQSHYGSIGSDMSIANELRLNLAIGWNGEIRYVSEKATTVHRDTESESEKRTGGNGAGDGSKPGEVPFLKDL